MITATTVYRRIGLTRLRRGYSKIRRKVIATLTILAFCTNSVGAQQILTDGKTQTSVVVNGNVTDVATSTMLGANAINSFDRFNVDQGNIVNLLLPTGAANLLNLVHGETSYINGVLNSIQDGKIGGNVFFLNPNGVIVGSGGTINVGSLTLVTPTKGFTDTFFDPSGNPSPGAVGQVLQGTVPVSESGLVVVKGKINAIRDINVAAGSVTNEGAIASGAVFVGSSVDFGDIVNVGDLAKGSGVAVENGKIEIVASGDFTNYGTISADGDSGLDAGAITIKAGNDILLDGGSVVSARGHGSDSSGGETLIYAGRNAEFASGAVIDTRGGETSGDGGDIEFSAVDTVTLAGGSFDASAVNGRAGAVLIDPNNIEIVSDNVFRGGSPYTLEANESITIADSVTISTRNIGAGTDQINSVSVGNSGDITLVAPTITVGNNARLLSHAVLNAGDAYTAGDIKMTGQEITLGSGAQILSYAAKTDGTRLSAAETTKGNITLTTSKVDHPGLLPAVASAGITINGATLKGRDITASVTADAGYDWGGDATALVVKSADTLAGLAAFGLTGVNVGVASSSGTSQLLVNGGSTLDAAGKVNLSATTTSTAKSLELGLGAFSADKLANVGFVYGHTDATATVDVKSGATIRGTDLTLSATNNAKLDVNVYGFSTSTQAEVAAAVTDASVHSTAQIASGATIDVNGSVAVKAVNNNSFNTGATAMALETGSVGVAAAFTNLDTGATASSGANLTTAGLQNVTIEATDLITQNKVASGGTAGSGLIVGKTLVPVLRGLDSAVTSIFSKKTESGKGTLDPNTGATEKPKVAASLTFAENVHEANASVGANATIDVAGDVAVTAKVSDELIRTHAISDVEGKTNDPKNPAATLALSGAVVIATYDHDAKATVGEGADVSAKHVKVRSDVLLPYEITWAKWDGISTLTQKLNGNLGIANGMLSGFSNAQSAAQDLGLAGAVNYFDFDNTSIASVERNATVTGKADVADPTGAAQVSVVSNLEATGVFSAGNISLTLNGAGGSDPTSTSVGGAYNQVDYDNISRAFVAEGAVITAPTGVGVEASTTSHVVSVAPSAGRGTSYGANLIFSLASINDTTEASVDDEAQVDAGSLTVRAQEDLSGWSLAGALTKSEAAGVGAAVAMNDITTNTKAFIGDNDINNADADDLDGSTLDLTTGQVTADSVNVNARTEGHVETITVAAAMASSSQPNDPNKPEPWGVTDKIKAGLVRALGKYNVFTYGPNPPPAQPTPTEPKFGIAFSGTASVNKTNLTTLASVDGAKLDLTGGTASSLSVTAVTDTDIAAIGGSASLVRANAPSSERSAGLAGSVAVNDLTNSTTASVKDSTVTGADDVAVNALAGGEQLAVAIGAAVNASGKQDSAASAAGSVSISLAKNTVSAGIADTTVTGDAAATGRNLGVVAYDRTKLGTGGGSLIAGGKAGFGAAVTYSSINNTSQAFLSGATVSEYDTVQVQGLTAAQIAAGGAMAGLTKESSGTTLGGTVVVSEISNTTSAEIKDTSDVTAASKVEVLAKDTTGVKELDDVIGAKRTASLDYSGTAIGATTPGASSILSVGGILQAGGKNNVGISVVWNTIDNHFKASVADSDLTVTGGQVNVEAQSNATITAYAVGAGVASQFAGGGSLTVNEITNETSATVSGSGKTITAGSLTVKATDDSSIDSLAGQVTISTGKASIGAAVADNEIANVTKATASDVDLDIATTLKVQGKNDSAIRTLSAAGGGAQEFAFNGSVSSSLIANTTEASIVNAESDETGQDAEVSATDISNISALSGAVALSGGASVGAAVAVNRIGNTTKAHVSGSAADAKYDIGNLLVQSTSASDIKSLAVGIGAGLKGGLAGSAATNFITSNNESYIDAGAKVVAQDNVGVVATTDDKITNAAGSAGVGLSVAGVGLSVTVNKISGDTKAYIAGSDAAQTQVTALGKNAAHTLTVAEGSLKSGVDLGSGLDLDEYGRTDLQALRQTETVTGVAVNAAATHSIENITANAGVGQYAGVAATTNVNLISGTTEAYVDGAKLNALTDGAGGTGQGVSVKASDHAYANGFVGTLAASLGAGVGMGVDTNIFDNETRAYLKDSTEARAAGAMTVAAESSQGVSSLVASGSVGAGAIVGTGSVAKFTGVTEAYVDSSTTYADDLSVAADHDSRFFVAAGGVTAGGIAAAGTFSVGIDSSRTSAYIDGSTVKATGAVNVDADGTSEMQNWAVSGSGGGAAGVAGNAVVSLVTNTTEAYVNDSDLGTAGARADSLSVTAKDQVTVSNKSGAIGIAIAGFGVGAGAAVTKVDNTTSAYVDNSDVYTTNAVAVDAQAERDLSTTAVSVGAGYTAGIGGAAAVTLVGRELSGDVTGELNKGNGGTLAKVDGLTGGDRISGDTAGAALTDGELTDLNGQSKADVGASLNPATLGSRTAALVSGASVVDAGTNVSITASEKDQASINAGAGGLGMVAVGGAVGVLDITNNVQASALDTASLTSGSGGITISAAAGRLSDTDAAASVASYQGSGGLVALGAAVATADVTNNVTASAAQGTKLTITGGSGELTVQATDSSDVEAEAKGLTVGLVAAGAVIADANKYGATTASIGDGPSTGSATAVDLASGRLLVNSSRTGAVTANSWAGAGGILSGSGSDADATDTGSSRAKIGGNVTVDGTHTTKVDGRDVTTYDAAVQVHAESVPKVAAKAEGYGGGYLANVGVSLAEATATPTVEASIGSGSAVKAKSLAVEALVKQTGSDDTAESRAVAGGGALIGVNATKSTATTTANVTASIGSALSVAGNVDLLASTTTKADATVSGITVGVVAAGAHLAKADADSTTLAAVANGVTGAVGGTLSVDATGSDDTYAGAVAGSGGVVAGAAASATTDNDSDTKAELGGGNGTGLLSAQSIALDAKHTATFNGKTDSLGAGVVGASGAVSTNDVDATVAANILDGARLSTYGLSVSAENVVRKPWLSGYNATAGSGGLFGGAAASSRSDIDLVTTVDIGDDSSVAVVGDKDNPGKTDFEAINDIEVRDKARLDAGGAIAVAKAESEIRVNKADATVSMGEGATLDSVGVVNLGARTNADVESEANAKTYGGAGAAEGQSTSDIHTSNDVTIGDGASIRADGNVNLYAGRDAAGGVNNLRAVARTDLWNKTALPIETDPAADASIDQDNRVDVDKAEGGTGAKVRSVGDINLLSTRGQTYADGQGTGKDLYRELAAKVASAFSNLFGGGDVSLDIKGGTSRDTGSAGVTVDGTVHAGIQNKQRLVIDAYGNVVEQTEGVTYTLTNENLVTNLFSRLEDLYDLQVAYSRDATAVAAYGAEIAAIKRELAALGYAGEAGGEYPYVDLDATFINVADVKARGGDVVVSADYLLGNGSVKAPADTEITIQNNSANFLRTGKLTIEDKGGHVYFNEETVTSAAGIHNPGGIGAANLKIEAAGSSSVTPTITVTNTFNPLGAQLPPPDIEVTGDVTNRTGAVIIDNLKGSVKLQGRSGKAAPSITAYDVDITAPNGSILQSYVDGFEHIGGDPRSYWSAEQNANEANKTDTSSGAYKPGGGSRIAGNNIFIAARHLNINGTIQSGIPDRTVVLDGSSGSYVTPWGTTNLNGYIAWVKQDWINKGRPSMANPASLNTYRLSGNSNGEVAAYFNPETNRIVLDNVEIRGGYVELFGEIMNTGGGKIRAMDGYGRISVSNNTGYDIVVNGLDNGNDIKGVIRITDTSYLSGGKPITTQYERIGGQVWQSQWVGDTPLGGFNTGNARSGSYSPADGLRYVWTRGQTFQEWFKGTSTSSKAFGFIPAGERNYDDWWQTATSNKRDLPNGTYTRIDTGAMGTNYLYDYANYDTTGLTFVNRKSHSHFYLLWTERTVEDTWTQGSQDVHTHSVKADWDIPVEFIGYDAGNANANINLSTNGNVILAGSVKNLGGTATITAGGNIQQTSAQAAVQARSVVVGAGTGMGSALAPVNVQLVGGDGSLKATTTLGDVYLKSTQGDVRVNLISSGSGNVSVDVKGNLVQAGAGNEAVIKGNRIDLVSGADIGTAGQALNVQAGSDQLAGLNASANGNISVRQPNGDFRLIRVESKSSIGGVTVEAGNGTLVDANPEVKKDTRTIAELQKLWDDMLLTGSDAAASADQTVKAYEQAKQSEYQKYWRLRNVRPVLDEAGVPTGGYVADAYDSTTANPELEALHAAYGGGTYNPNWSYTASETERTQLTQGSAWTENELKNALGGGILFKQTGYTETNIKPANVKGHNVTLRATQGSVGTDDGQLVIDGNDPNALKNETNRIALAAAEVDDVGVDNATKQITVLKRKALNVEIVGDGELVAEGRDHVYLGSREPIYVKTVDSGGSIRIKGAKGLYSVATSGTAAIQGGRTILEGGQGQIGTEERPLTTDLTPGSQLTARSDQDIYIDQLVGSLSVAEVYSPADVHLTAGGSILDSRGARPVAIQGHNVSLTAEDGSIGADGAPLAVNVAPAGELNAYTDASGSIYLTSPASILNLGTVSAGTTVVASATGGELNLTGTVSASGHVSLSATNGPIAETASGRVSAVSLTTSSNGGQTLNGSNDVGSFSATNTAGGDIAFTNASGPLTVNSITQVDGGDVMISNTVGDLSISGAITTSDAVHLDAVDGAVAETATGRIQAAMLTAASTGGQTLNGANSLGGFEAVNAGGGEIQLTNTSGLLTVTNITQDAGSDVVIDQAGGDLSIVETIATSEDVRLSAANGAIVEAGVGRIQSATLTTASNAGQMLNGSNDIGSFSATNSGGGDIQLTNSFGPLTITGVTQDAGGDVVIDNTTGELSLAGVVSTSDDVRLNAADGAIVETGAGRIIATVLSTASNGGQTLNAANDLDSFSGTNTGGGDIQLTNTSGPLTIIGVAQDAGGDVVIDNTTGDLSIAGAILASDGVRLNVASGSIAEAGSGAITAAALTTLSAGDLDLSGDNAIGSLAGVDAGGDVKLYNTVDLSIAGTVTTPGSVRLTATRTLAEVGAGRINATTLHTESVGGQTLNGANTVGSFSAINDDGGNIELTNAADPLVISGITQLDGGDVIIDNDGAIEGTGAIDTTGAVSLTTPGDISLARIVAGELRLRVPTVGRTVTVHEARIARGLTASADNIYLDDLIHTSKSPLMVDLAGGSKTMADNVKVFAESPIGITFSRLSADFARVDAKTDHLSLLNMTVGSQAWVNNRYHTVVADNVSYRLFDCDVQLYPRNNPFYLVLSNDRKPLTDAYVVNYDDHFITNEFSTEDSFIRETTKMTEVVNQQPQLTMGQTSITQEQGPGEDDEDLVLTDDGLNAGS